MLMPESAKSCLLSLFFVVASLPAPLWAQPPSHDPSTMIKNVDGRYFVFSTGNGIWAMSSSDAEFTNWSAENSPFAHGTWPSWINSYVTGFDGHFWAPDVIKIGNEYFLYYSCAGDGAPAAIGVTKATDLQGPWTDLGMVYAGNNAIDPSVFMDGDRLWMTWGNWVEGIDICELDPSTGKRLNTTKTKLVSGSVEGPTIYKRDGYYYLFYQRGLCCNGVNSTYYNVVARSASITGPFTGERTFLSNKNGRFIGPGHVGLGEGKLTYHFYDGDDNGAAKMMVTSVKWENGWPVANFSYSPALAPNANYRITAKHSALALNVLNCGTTSGTDVNQNMWADNNCQKWNMTSTVAGIFRLSPLNAPLQALDVTNCNNANSTNIRLWSWLDNDCQKWKMVDMTNGYYQIKNVATNKCLSISNASLANGATALLFDCSSFAPNMMFSFQNGDSPTAIDVLQQGSVSVYPNPTNGVFQIALGDNFTGKPFALAIYDMNGRCCYSDENKVDGRVELPSLLPLGYYVMTLTNSSHRAVVRLVISQ
jgi:arabinan endo-1,5-alpha-L-arabinosidase